MKRASQTGFSLLEVILALAILGGALAALGEAASQAMHNARIARETARAQLLCEGKMAELAAQLVPLESGQGVVAPSTDPGQPAWVYNIEKSSLEEDGLCSVRVTVAQDLPKQKRPVSFTLVRWLVDPNYTASNATNQTPTQTSDQTSGSGGTQ